MPQTFDAIVVGARCAGSPTAMLLGRKGYRVLVVDRATFPSDTLSTHVVQPLAVGALDALGTARSPDRDRLSADSYLHLTTSDPFTIAGAPGTASSPVAYCPRRTVLDKLLVDAAAEAGAEIREGFTVEEILIEDGRVAGIKGHSKGGAAVTERATVVIGADGRHSLVAQAVRPEQYNEKPPLLAPYYTYWSGLPIDGRFDTYIRPHARFRGRADARRPDADGRRMAVRRVRGEQERCRGPLPEVVRAVPAFAERVRGAKREAPIRGRAGVRISSASRTAPAGRWSATPATTRIRSPRRASTTPSATPNSCATALDQALQRRPPVRRGAWPSISARATSTRCRCTNSPVSWRRWSRRRRRCSSCSARSRAISTAMDGFAQMNAGTISPVEFGAAVARAHE